MNREQLLKRVEKSIFPAREELKKLLSNETMVVKSGQDDEVIARCFLLPIRSRIKVVSLQCEQTVHIKNVISQSKHLVSVWEADQERLCSSYRVDLDSELYFLVFCDPHADDIFGALQYVNVEHKHKHVRPIEGPV